MSTFRGQKETCDNFNGELDMSWDKFEQTNIPEVEGSNMSFEQICFNICGENHYIENIGTRGVCRPCPTKPEEWTPDNRVNETQQITDLRSAGLLGMCSDFNTTTIEQSDGSEIPEWFIRQQSANIQQNFNQGINWSSDEAKLLWSHYSSYNEGDQTESPVMSDQQLLAMFGSRIPGEFNEDNTPIFSLPGKYGDPNDQPTQLQNLKVEINTGRGSTIDCPRPILSANNSVACQGKGGDWNESGTCTAPDPGNWVLCTEDKFGINDIIYEEAYDYWLSEFDRLDPTTESDTTGIRAFSDLLSGISIDSNFEACVNDVLNTGDNDNEIQQRIQNYKKVTDFGNKDINYLQAKLRRIILVKESDMNECMNMLNISESICTTGVSDKMLQIGHLVFSIIGANKIDLVDLDVDDRYHLNRMVTKLGPLLPQAIKNIIHISKEYEMRICNKPSTTTLLLERLYLDLYDNQVNVELNINPYLGFSEMIDTPNTLSGIISYMKQLIPILCLGIFLLTLLKYYWGKVEKEE